MNNSLDAILDDIARSVTHFIDGPGVYVVIGSRLAKRDRLMVSVYRREGEDGDLWISHKELTIPQPESDTLFSDVRRYYDAAKTSGRSIRSMNLKVAAGGEWTVSTSTHG